jgi:predicted  nucleic acid-binding Zn-ribbon protein
MQLDPKQLSPENYTNPRFIELKNEEIGKLYEKIKALQEKVNPDLLRYEELEKQASGIKEEMKDLVERMKAEDQKASKVKEKLVPLVEEEVLKELTELDEFVGIDLKDGKYYAKVNDRIEEWLKAVREQKK